MSGRPWQRRRARQGSQQPQRQPPASAEPAVPAETPPEADGDDTRRPRWMEMALRVAGAVIGVWAGALLALYGSFLTPVRLGTTFLPVSLVLAIGGNIALIWFGYTVTRHKFFALLPGLVWAGLSFVASTRTTEGDLVLIDTNWVAVVYLLAGCVTIGITAYRMFLPRP